MANADWDIHDEGDEEELEWSAYTESLKDVLLFAIDCSESMLATRQGNKSHFQAVLEAAIDLQKRKVMYSPNDSVGMLFFNTVEKTVGGKMGDIKEHIYIYQPISQIHASDILKLLALVAESKEKPNHLRETFRPWGKSIPLGDVFSTCNWVLRDNAPKAATKRIFLVTDNDDPHQHNAHLNDVAHNTLNDLYALGVTIEPFFISTPERPFNPSKAYSRILSRSDGQRGREEDDELEVLPNVIQGFERLLEDMKIREAPKRSMFSIPLTLGSGFTIGIKGYGLIISQKKPNAKYFIQTSDGELKEAFTKTVYYEKGTLNDSLEGGQLVYGVSLGSSAAKSNEDEDEPGDAVAERSTENQVSLRNKFYFTADEVKTFRSLGMNPGLKLLGFKDASELSLEDNIKHSYFIYPNEGAYVGSTRTFAALLQSMLKKNKIGLLVGLFRRNSSPYFYAMVPQAETLDEDGAQETPPGFYLVPLPYADDIRGAPVERGAKASRELIDAAAAIIEKVNIKKGYQPDAYPNPSFALHYQQLEALAFEQDFVPEEFNDQTAPKLDMIHKRTGPLVERWKEVLEEDPNANTYVVTAGTKRNAAVSVDEAEVRSRSADGTLSKLTNDTLKAFLKSKSLPVSGKKADLLDRIEGWLEKHS